ncbi:MAG: lysophospholipid acyltransferase family protein [Chromatiales bacterium]|jgi:1-acyl-sn-glycerol-3-phosphate acyltransferase
MVLARSLVYFALLAATTFVFALPMVLFGRVIPHRWLMSLSGQWACTNLRLQKAVCGLGYEIQGMENLPEGGVIVMAKHQSAWETIALRGLLPRRQTWVLKRELLWVPVFGWALAMTGPIAVDRKAGRAAARQLVDEGRRRLDQGHCLILFPEGTRVAPGEHGKYHIGGGLLAAASGYPVVPIAHNAGVFWARRGVKKYPGTIRVVLGAPIPPQDLSAAQITRRVEQWIEQTMETLPAQRS